MRTIPKELIIIQCNYWWHEQLLKEKMKFEIVKVESY